MQRPCLTCGTPTTGSRCPAHQRQHERDRRPSTAERGYGAAHQAARRALAELLPIACAYGCGTTLYPGSPWVAAHVVDGQPERGWMASCGPCNERAKQRPG